MAAQAHPLLPSQAQEILYNQSISQSCGDGGPERGFDLPGCRLASNARDFTAFLFNFSSIQSAVLVMWIRVNSRSRRQAAALVIRDEGAAWTISETRTIYGCVNGRHDMHTYLQALVTGSSSDHGQNRRNDSKQISLPAVGTQACAC